VRLVVGGDADAGGSFVAPALGAELYGEGLLQVDVVSLKQTGLVAFPQFYLAAGGIDVA